MNSKPQRTSASRAWALRGRETPNVLRETALKDPAQPVALKANPYPKKTLIEPLYNFTPYVHVPTPRNIMADIVPKLFRYPHPTIEAALKCRHAESSGHSREMIEKFLSRHSGAENAHRIHIFAGGAQ